MAMRCCLCLCRCLPRRALPAISRALAVSSRFVLREHSSAAAGAQLRLKRQDEELEEEREAAATALPPLPPSVAAAGRAGSALLLDRRLPARSQTGRCYANGELLRARWLLERDRRGRRLSYKTDIGVSSALYAQITGGGSATRLIIDLTAADELRKQLRGLARLRFPLRTVFSRHTVAHGLHLSASCSQLQLEVATGSSSRHSAPHCFLLLSLPIERCALGLPQSERTTSMTLELQLRVSVFDSLQCAASLLLMAEATQLEQLSQRIGWRMEEFATGFLSSNVYRLLDATTLPEAETDKAAYPSSKAAAGGATGAKQQEEAVQLLQTVTGGLKARMSSSRMTVAEPEQAVTDRSGDRDRPSAGLAAQQAEKEEEEQAEEVDDAILVDGELEGEERETEAETEAGEVKAQVPDAAAVKDSLKPSPSPSLSASDSSSTPSPTAAVKAGGRRPPAPSQPPARGVWKFSPALGGRQLRVVLALPLPVSPRVWERLLHDLRAPERGLLPHHNVGNLFSSSPPPLSRLYAVQPHTDSGVSRVAHCALPAEHLSATLRDCLPSLSRSVRFQQRQFTVQPAQRLRVEYYAPSPLKDGLLRLVLPWSVDCTEEKEQQRPVQQSAVDSFKLTVSLNVFPVVAPVQQKEALQPANDMEHLSKRARLQLHSAANKLQRMLRHGMQQIGQQDSAGEEDRDRQVAERGDSREAAEQREEAGKEEQQVALQPPATAQEAAAVSGEGEAGTTPIVSAAVPPAATPPEAVEPAVPPPPPAADFPRASREGVTVIRVPAGGGGMQTGPGGGAAGGSSTTMKRLRRWWRKSGFGQSVLLIMIGCVAVTYVVTSGNFGVNRPPAAQQASKKATSSSSGSRQQQSTPPSPPSSSPPAAQTTDPPRPQQS